MKPTTTTGRIKVRATQTGYYGEARRRPGDVFELADERDFSRKWMEPVPASTPDTRSTNQDVIQREHDTLLASRMRNRKPTGTANPLGTQGGGEPNLSSEETE